MEFTDTPVKANYPLCFEILLYKGHGLLEEWNSYIEVIFGKLEFGGCWLRLKLMIYELHALLFHGKSVFLSPNILDIDIVMADKLAVCLGGVWRNLKIEFVWPLGFPKCKVGYKFHACLHCA